MTSHPKVLFCAQKPDYLCFDPEGETEFTFEMVNYCLVKVVMGQNCKEQHMSFISRSQTKRVPEILEKFTLFFFEDVLSLQ